MSERCSRLSHSRSSRSVEGFESVEDLDESKAHKFRKVWREGGLEQHKALVARWELGFVQGVDLEDSGVTDDWNTDASLCSCEFYPIVTWSMRQKSEDKHFILKQTISSFYVLLLHCETWLAPLFFFLRQDSPCSWSIAVIFSWFCSRATPSFAVSFCDDPFSWNWVHSIKTEDKKKVSASLHTWTRFLAFLHWLAFAQECEVGASVFGRVRWSCTAGTNVPTAPRRPLLKCIAYSSAQ